MRQSASLVFIPITVNKLTSFFNCMPVGRASDSMMGPNKKLVDFFKVGWTRLSLVCCLIIRGSAGGFLLFRLFSALFYTLGISGVSIYGLC